MAHILRAAEVQYGDFIGTSAADRADAGAVGLDRAVGIDTERWWILAFDIYAAEKADLDRDCVRVYAVDKKKSGISSYDELQAYGREHGSVPVTEFMVHGIAAKTIVMESFKRFAVQLRSRSLEGLDLDVVAESDLNYSEK